MKNVIMAALFSVLLLQQCHMRELEGQLSACNIKSTQELEQVLHHINGIMSQERAINSMHKELTVSRKKH